MRTPFISFFVLALAGTLLISCGSAPSGSATTAALSLVLNGVARGNVSVTGNGRTVFQGEVEGSKTLPPLPKGTYTVTPDDVAGFITPAPQKVELSTDRSVALTYTRSDTPTEFTAHLGIGTVTMGPGDQVEVPVDVEALHGFKGKVRLTVMGLGLPAGISATSPVIDLGASTTVRGILTLTGDRTLGSTQYTLQIFAQDVDSGEGVLLPLVVLVPPPLLSVQTSFMCTYAGTPTDASISLTGRGYAGAATLSVDGLPEGITVELPGSVTVGSTPTVVPIRVTAGLNAPLGTVGATLILSAGGQRLFMPLTVNVQPQRFAASELAGEAVSSIASDSAGNAWYTTWDQVRRISPDGTRAAYPFTGYLFHLQVGSDGLVYGANWHNIVRLNPATGQIQRWYLGWYDAPDARAWDGGGKFVVLDGSHLLYPTSDGVGGYGFGLLNTTTGEISNTMVPGILNYPRSATLVGDTVYFYAPDSTTWRLYGFDLATGSATSFADEHTTGVESVVARTDGSVWLIRATTVDGRVSRELVLFDPGSGQSRVMTQIRVDLDSRVLANPDGSAWVTGLFSPQVQRVNPQGGLVSTFDPEAVPNRIAVSSRGDFWFSFGIGDTTYLSRLH
ncbi:hypothetical protein [Deinococcus yunweiensis]|uniref:hypothetical protein n=1 Tax=Deinococcus yunweiensis TaxID=367282 RepID=UPI00398F3416